MTLTERSMLADKAVLHLVYLSSQSQRSPMSLRAVKQIIEPKPNIEAIVRKQIAPRVQPGARHLRLKIFARYYWQSRLHHL